MRNVGSLLLVGCLIALPLGCGPTEDKCKDVTCSDHGTCDDSSGAPVCVCDTGYNGSACASCADGYHDVGGTCTEDIACADSTCSGHGTCDDSSGVPVCHCDDAYHGDHCDACAADYQDNDANGTCLATCATSGLTCGSFGACEDTSGTAVCACVAGYEGALCDACAPDYQDNDKNGTCLPICATSGLDCGSFGACEDTSGTAVCACVAGYEGALCDACAPDYQDNDTNGTCEPTCATSGLDCGSFGTCDDTSGTAVCVCTAGYAGALCDACAPGYQDNDTNRTCLPTCVTSGLNCGNYGACEDASGAASCVCMLGYEGALCDACAPGYQDNDTNGTCEPTCATSGLNCGNFGACEDASGATVCVCMLGYEGALCNLCALGYQDNDTDGTCLPTCATSGLNCGNFGACEDASGAAMCVCTAGYAGALCDACTPDYQDNDANGTCLPTCATSGLNCGNYGACEDASGAAVCVCLLGYEGALCDACASNYQDNDTNGTCEPTCATSGLNCGNYGACEDASGVAVCVCTAAYAGALCDACAPGYQDNDTDGTCAPTCATSGLNCGNYGACEDASGAAACVCTAGHAGALCDACALGYQDNDTNGTCLPDCESLAWTCADHGVCDDSTGDAVCLCEQGYFYDGQGNCLPHGNGFTCARPLLLDLSESEVTGTTVGSGNDTVPSCKPNSTAPEVVYVFAIAEPLTVTFTTTGFDTIIYLRANCASGPDLACDDDGGPGTGSQIRYTFREPGLYYLFVDGFGANSGTYTLSIDVDCGLGAIYDSASGVCVDDPCDPNPCTVPYQSVCVAEFPNFRCDCDPGYLPDNQGGCSLDPNPPGESCADARALPVAEVGQEKGTTADAVDNAAASCGNNATGPDRVYWFDLDSERLFHAETDGAYDSVLHLRRVCDDQASQVVCDDDSGPGSGSAINAPLSAGRYYLWVDTYTGRTGGPYVLSYTFRSNPCADEEAACPGVATCQPSADWSSFTCVCPAGSLPWNGGCVDDPCTPDNPCTKPHATVCTPELPDSYKCSCSPGYVPDPANPEECIGEPGEDCGSEIAIDVAQPGELAGHNTTSVNNASGSCGGNGPDRVYTFTLPYRARAEIGMSGYDTVLHLRTTCADAATQVACDDDSGEGSNSLLVANLPAGTYYLWADSFGNSGGDYTLTWSFRQDPCLDDEAVCPGTPVCSASEDFGGYSCVCPEGMLPWESDCVDNPCTPDNPCTQENKNRCIPDLPDAYHCECNLGYIGDPDSPESCIQDPNGNKWAFIVFLNADNNLESYGYGDVEEMGVAGSNMYVHIVSQFDTSSGDGGATRRIYITQGGYNVVENIGEADMGNWQTLRDYAIWAIQNYPAQHYALIMWDHGDGWSKRGKPAESPVVKGFSNDDHGSGEGISVANGDYARALAGITQFLGRKLDIVGFDACLMGMWEVAEASAPYADYLVSSSETEPGDGWDYDGFLPQLVQSAGNMTPAELGRAIVDSYAAQDYPTQSLTDLSTISDLNTAVSNFANALQAHPELYAQIDTIRGQTQTFYTTTHRDLWDFALRVQAIPGIPADLQATAAGLIAQLRTSIVHFAGTYATAHGLAVYFPSRGSFNSAEYSNATWSLGATWDDFLRNFR